MSSEGVKNERHFYQNRFVVYGVCVAYGHCQLGSLDTAHLAYPVRRVQNLAILQGEHMTSEQFLILSACIWLAPHVPNGLGLVNGCAALIVAVAIGLGWIT
jgi:hypothetical protein